MSFYSVHQSYFICAFSYFTNYGTFWMFRSKSTMNLTRFYMTRFYLTRFYLTPCAGTPSRPVSYPASRLQNESPTAELRQPVHRKSFGFNRWENTFTFWYHNCFVMTPWVGISAVSCFMLRWEGVGMRMCRQLVEQEYHRNYCLKCRIQRRGACFWNLSRNNKQQ